MKKIISLLFALICSNAANALVIKADDLAIGTDISNTDSRIELTVWSKVLGQRNIVEQPLVVNYVHTIPGDVYYGRETHLGITQGTHGMDDYQDFHLLDPVTPHLYMQFTGIHVQSTEELESIEYFSNSWSGESNWGFFYNRDGKLISVPYQQRGTRIYYDMFGSYVKHSFAADLRGKGIYSAMLGSVDSPAYIHTLKVFVPESLSIPLLTIGLLLMLFARIFRN